MRNQLPHSPRLNEATIINLASLESEGTHWCCFKKRGLVVKYFDPFGNLKPPKELLKYLKGCEILYNYARRQDFDTVICGHLCLEFLCEK